MALSLLRSYSLSTRNTCILGNHTPVTSKDATRSASARVTLPRTRRGCILAAKEKSERPEEADEAVDVPGPKAPRLLVEPADKVEHKWRLNVRLPKNVDPDTVVLSMDHKEGWLGVLWRDMNDPREPDEFHHHLLMPDPKGVEKTGSP
jgi:hypothetical protein